MFSKKFMLRAASVSLTAIALLTAQPVRAQSSSESDRLEKLERAVEQLQERNAELEKEVSTLRKQTASAPGVSAEGPTKTQTKYDGKTYVEKTVPVEKTS